MTVRTSSVHWQGKGSMKLGSGAYEVPYSFRPDLKTGDVLNPEELEEATFQAEAVKAKENYPVSVALADPKSVWSRRWCSQHIGVDRISANNKGMTQ